MTVGAWAAGGSSGQAIPDTGWSTLNMGAAFSDAGNIVSDDDGFGTFKIDAEGYYLIVGEATLQGTNNNRIIFKLRLMKNGVELVGSQVQSGYIRNSNNRFHSTRGAAIAHFSFGDTFEFQHTRDTGSGTPAGSYFRTQWRLIRLTSGAAGDTPFIHASVPGSGLVPGDDDVRQAIGSWNTVVTTDTSVLDINADGTTIDLKQANRPILFVYGLGYNTASNRTQVITRATLNGTNGTNIPHAGGYSYIRDGNNNKAAAGGIGIVRPNVTTDRLSLDHTNQDTTGGPQWGTVNNNNNDIVASEAGVMAIALPPSLEIVVGEVANAAQGVSGGSSVVHNWNTTEVERDVASFINPTPSQIELAKDMSLWAYGGTLLQRTAANGARHSRGMGVVVSGSFVINTQFNTYLRGDQGSQDATNAFLAANYATDLGAGGTIRFQSQDAGDNGANDIATWGGGFVINLDTLDAPQPPQTIPASVVEVRITILPGAVVAGTSTILGPVVDLETIVLPGGIEGSASVLAAPSLVGEVEVVTSPLVSRPATIPAPSTQIDLSVATGAIQGTPNTIPEPVVVVTIDVLPGVVVGEVITILGPIVSVSLDVVPGVVVGEAITILRPIVSVSIDVVPGTLVSEAGTIPAPIVSASLDVVPGTLVSEAGIIPAPEVPIDVSVLAGAVTTVAATVAGPVVDITLDVRPGSPQSAAAPILAPQVQTTLGVAPGAILGTPGIIPGPIVNTLEGGTPFPIETFTYEPFGGGQSQGSLDYIPGGVRLNSNDWRRTTDGPFFVAADWYMDLEVLITAPGGEIQGICFSSTTTSVATIQTQAFQFGGFTPWATRAAEYDYDAMPGGYGVWKQLRIPIGDKSGLFTQFSLIADDDGPPAPDVSFRNLRVGTAAELDSGGGESPLFKTVLPGAVVGEAGTILGSIVNVTFDVLPGDVGGDGPLFSGPIVENSIDVLPGVINAEAATITGPLIDVRLLVEPGSFVVTAGVVAAPVVDVDLFVVVSNELKQVLIISPAIVATTFDVLPGDVSGEPQVISTPGLLNVDIDVVPGGFVGETQAIAAPLIVVQIEMLPGGIVPSSAAPGPIVFMGYTIVPGGIVGEPQVVVAPIISLERLMLPGALVSEPGVIIRPVVELMLFVAVGNLIRLIIGNGCPGHRTARVAIGHRNAEGFAGHRLSSGDVDHRLPSATSGHRLATIITGDTTDACST